MSFTARLKQARLSLAAREGNDVRAADAARSLGVTRAAWSQWESGASKPGVDMIERLADYLGVDPGWLAFGVGDSGIEPKRRQLPEAPRSVPVKKRNGDPKRKRA